MTDQREALLAEKDARIAALEEFIRRYRYRIKGGDPMQYYIDQLLQPNTD